MTRLTAKAWFGPKRYGRGLRPVTWQGIAVTAAAVVGPFAATRLFSSTPIRIAAGFAVIGLLLVVVLITSGPPRDD